MAPAVFPRFLVLGPKDRAALACGRCIDVILGSIHALFKANVQIVRIEDKEKDNHPDYTVSTGGKDIGVAWDYEDDRGHYVSIAFEEPSLAPGSYKLVKTGAEKGYTLTYRKPSFKKDKK